MAVGTERVRRKRRLVAVQQLVTNVECPYPEHSPKKGNAMSVMETTDSVDHTAVDQTIEEVRNRINKEAVTKQINEFIDIISTDGFLDYVNDIAQLPTYSQRREYTAETANLGTLVDRKVPTPEGLRLTTREFEVPEDGQAANSPLVQVRPGLDPRMGWCVSIGYILCGSYGG